MGSPPLIQPPHYHAYDPIDPGSLGVTSSIAVASSRHVLLEAPHRQEYVNMLFEAKLTNETIHQVGASYQYSGSPNL